MVGARAVSEPDRRVCSASDGVQIAYQDWGGPSRTAVLLCHGLAASSEQLQADAAYFAAAGHRVLVPDLRGHGRSGKALHADPRGYAIDVQGRDMLGVLDHAGVERVHWIGNSLGGIVALPLLLRHAERFVSFASFGTAYAQSLSRWAPASIPLAHAILGPRLRGVLTAKLTTQNRAARPLIARLVANSDPEVGRQVALQALCYDYTAEVQQTAVPILLLRGEYDVAVNRMLAPTLPRLSEKPGFRIVELLGGGHCSNLDATTAWRAALMTFWTEN